MATQAEQQYSSATAIMAIMKQLPSITIPPLHCSFPWRLHPLTPHLKLTCDAWLLARFSHLHPPSTNAGGWLYFNADRLLHSAFPLLAFLTYPSAAPSRVETAVKFFAWFFLLDSVLDDPAEMGANSAAADALINCIVDVLEQPSYCYSGDNLIIKAMVETAQDWWYAMCQGMPPRQQARFIAHLKDYLEANRPQILFRSAGTLPDLDTYTRIRADDGGWQPCSVLIEYAHAIELDEETLDHPLVVALRSVAAYNVYWVNDLCSFKKELLENDLLNIVPVLYCHNMKQQKKDVSLESIVGEVCTMIKECDEECVRLMGEIKASKLLMKKAGMAEYLEGVGDWLGGSRYWHLVSGRYGVGASADMYHCPPETAVHHKLSMQDVPAPDLPMQLN